jgi:hypothetical protein
MKREDRDQLLTDLETLSFWKQDLVRRTRAAELCQASSVGLADARREALLHEGKALLRAMNGVMKRLRDNDEGAS